MIDQIVDLIIREALSRKGDLAAKVCEVNVEVMLVVAKILDNHNEGERDEQRKQASRLGSEANGQDHSQP